LKDSKKNLPRALIIGGIVIVAVYLFYYIGVAGGASNQELIEIGAQVAFTNIFGNVLGNILKLFIAVSCLGTLNGLMLGCSRGMYSIAVRKEGPAPEMFSQVDRFTNMPNNSSVFALIVTAAWLLYFYVTNLYLPGVGISNKAFMFDSSELPIITIYLMYLPIFIQWIRKQKEESAIRRFVMPVLAIAGSVFMVIACIFSHGMGCFWYVLVFLVVMALGHFVNKGRK
jgi:APA family basic amino acid/polyamine antiporter